MIPTFTNLNFGTRYCSSMERVLKKCCNVFTVNRSVLMDQMCASWVLGPGIKIELLVIAWHYLFVQFLSRAKVQGKSLAASVVK